MFQNDDKQNEVSKNERRAWTIDEGVAYHLRKEVLHQAEYKDTLVAARHLWSMDSSKSSAMERLIEADCPDIQAAEVAIMDRSELIQTLADIVNTEEPMDHMNILLLLEDQICNRIKQFTLQQDLYIADLFYLIQYKPNRYYKVMFRHFDHSWEILGPSPHNVVQLMFYIGLVRDAPVTLLSKIESYLVQHVDYLSGKEVSLICFSFFVTNRAIWDIQLLDLIAHKTLQEAAHMKLHLTANILKAFRHASYDRASFYEKLGTILSKHEDVVEPQRISPLMHTAATFAAVRMQHNKLFHSISRGLWYLLTKKKIKGRNKDLTRLIWSFGFLQIPLRLDIMALLIKRSLSNATFQTNYPESFVEGLISLSLYDIFPEDLISESLSPDFQKMKSSKYYYIVIE